jgi:predicted CoA-substrate-specific enzyme activase
MQDQQTSFRLGLDIGSHDVKIVIFRGTDLLDKEIFPVAGRPLEAIRLALEWVNQNFPYQNFYIGITGFGSAKIREILHLTEIHESTALAKAIDHFLPDDRDLTVIEIGHMNQRYLRLHRNARSGRLGVTDSNLGGKCAAGSGSFLKAMANRFSKALTDLGDIALSATGLAAIAGRCAVFAESDIVSAFQSGTPVEMIIAGIHMAVVRSFHAAVAKKKKFFKTIFIGGVSDNSAICLYMKQELKIKDMIIPEHNRHLAALGAAKLATKKIDLVKALSSINEWLTQPFDYQSVKPITLISSPELEKINLPDLPNRVNQAFLGIDIGSVSTKIALITYVNEKLAIIGHYYRWTEGNPLLAVHDALEQIKQQVDAKGIIIDQIIAGTTGSGRFLTADFVGTTIVRGEISAQCQGAFALDPTIDTIVEIGGQDGKIMLIENGVLRRFDMNKVCAAGTGDYIKTQAEKIGLSLEEFGPLAITNQRPPLIDSTCAVYAGAAIDHFMANNVPLPDLAAGICIGAINNFMAKTVGNCPIGKNVAFQGATAFNIGLRAAFETILGQPVHVSEFCHITGAIGAASLARLEFLENPEVSYFRGFSEIATLEYESDAFECKGCDNHCMVKWFQFDQNGPKRYYGDRCEKFSGNQKKSKRGDLPDLFAERETWLMESYNRGTPGEDAKTIGIPRGLMFSEIFPLLAEFSAKLGFKVVTSDPTNKHIIELGLNNVVGEPCFPFKVAHGHVANLIEKGVDIILMPRVINTEQTDPGFEHAQTCPYLQAAPEQIGAALGLRNQEGILYLTPSFHFQHGKRRLAKAFIELGSQLGKSSREAKEAFKAGLNAMANFQRKVEARGQQIMIELPEDALAFVVISRPYTAWDSGVNMKIASRILDMGVLAIPQDYLPLAKSDISSDWGFIYSRQIQKKLAAASIINKDPRLRAIVLSYFGCGPDSFANQFLEKILSGSYYVMHIDEHTGDAHVITRLEAFYNTVKNSKASDEKLVQITEDPMTDLDQRVLWIPQANQMAYALAASLRAYGVNAHVLPRSPDKGLSLARAAITEDVCLPSLITVEDMLWRIHQPGFNPAKEAFFTGSSNGPCRFGMYYALMRLILDHEGYTDVKIATLGIKTTHGGLGMKFVITAWKALVTSDILFKMMLKVRPYETTKGDTERAFDIYIKRLEKILPEEKQRMGLGNLLDTSLFENLLAQAAHTFAAISVRTESRPLIGIVGEFFVRLHDGANQDILRKLEALGAETWLAPGTEFFSYANYIGMVLLDEKIKTGAGQWKDHVEHAKKWVNWKIMTHIEHQLFHACSPFLAGYDDIGSAQVVELGTRYIHHDFGGEAICSMGKSVDFARRSTVSGIVSVIPFNCMPGNVVTAMSQELRNDEDDIPFLNLSYDGYPESRRDLQLAEFMAQVHERFISEKIPDQESNASKITV